MTTDETNKTPQGQSEANPPAGANTETLYEVKVDGKVEKATLDQMRESHSKNLHFTREMQNLANDRRTLDAERKKLNEERQTVLAMYEELSKPPEESAIPPEWENDPSIKKLDDLIQARIKPIVEKIDSVAKSREEDKILAVQEQWARESNDLFAKHPDLVPFRESILSGWVRNPKVSVADAAKGVMDALQSYSTKIKDQSIQEYLASKTRAGETAEPRGSAAPSVTAKPISQMTEQERIDAQIEFLKASAKT